jgi:hypothetical protein
MLLTLISAHGSPGVTTAAAALAAVLAEQRAESDRGQPVDLVELDPAGGDIEPYTGAVGESGLLRAACDLRPAALADHTVEAPPGVRSLLAPTSASEANSTVMAALDGWCGALATFGGPVVADAGRWEMAHPAAGRLVGSGLVALVCRPDPRSAEHARHIVADVRALAWPAPIAVVTVGDRPYGLAEVAGVLGGVPAGGALAWDPKGAAALWSEGAGARRFRRWPSCWLARSARAVAAELVQLADQVPAR